MNLSWHHSAIAALIALAPLTAAAAPAEVGTPALAWQSVGTLSPRHRIRGEHRRCGSRTIDGVLRVDLV